MLGNMWWWGTAVIVPLHHDHFARFSPAIMDHLAFIAPFFAYSTLLFELSWALLLVPKTLYRKTSIRYEYVRRFVLIGGFFFHFGILVLMNVGSFFWAMMTAYFGLIEAEDIRWLRGLWNRKWKGRISVFFDGNCGFCTRSVFWIGLMDWLGRVRLVNFQNPVLRKKFAPDLAYKDLDRSMHIRYPVSARSKDEVGRTIKGFRAFRSLTWHLPPAWIIAPFLYLPGVSNIGERVYQWKAKTRKRCAHGDCKV
jgi:predicted DCC family thiol-disulfide oxidoreductase YuxK